MQYSDERFRLREATKESLLKRTQFDAGLKIQKKFLGPYKISRCKRNNRYEVIRVGGGEGPKITTQRRRIT